MKSLTFSIIIVSLLFAGCAAVYVDKEFGTAQMISHDMQIVYPDYRYAQKIPTNMDGIFAEDVIAGYSESFKESFSRQPINTMQTGSGMENQ